MATVTLGSVKINTKNFVPKRKNDGVVPVYSQFYNTVRDDLSTIRDEVNKKAVATLTFGGVLDSTGRFALANGSSGDADSTSDKITIFPAIAGTINRVIFFSAGDLSSNNATISIHVNGSSKGSFTASAGTNSSEVATGLGISVSDGDNVQIEYNAGATTPGETITQVLIEQ